MIRFENVTRHYGDAETPALREVSVEFQRGDFVFLIGASGSGKSTLLRMILREALPQQGKVTVAGQNLRLMLERRVPEYRRSVGMVFQDFRLLPDKTVYENVAFAMRVIGAPRSSIRKRVMNILSRVKLDHLAKRYPHEISGGEQQRAAIARAIVNSPAIVLADEPTGNLDPRASEEVMKILRWINASGTTVIMATHDRAIVDRMRRRVVQLHRGQLVRDEVPGLYDPPQGSEAWDILSTEEAATGLRASDPTPLRMQSQPVLEVEHPTGGEPLLDKEQSSPASAKDRMTVSHYRVTWPEDDPDTTDESDMRSDVDAANLPELDEPLTSNAELLPEPEPTPERPVQEPIPTAVRQTLEPQRRRLDWLSHASDSAGAADSSEPSADPAGRAENSGEVPPAESVTPPRPRASAAEATYADTQRTAEQLRSSKSGLRRWRRGSRG